MTLTLDQGSTAVASLLWCRSAIQWDFPHTSVSLHRPRLQITAFQHSEVRGADLHLNFSSSLPKHYGDLSQLSYVNPKYNSPVTCQKMKWVWCVYEQTPLVLWQWLALCASKLYGSSTWCSLKGTKRLSSHKISPLHPSQEAIHYNGPTSQDGKDLQEMRVQGCQWGLLLIISRGFHLTSATLTLAEGRKKSEHFYTGRQTVANKPAKEQTVQRPHRTDSNQGS